ncbi:MAG: YbjN domain-containing protein [Myxococcota bacterium]
MRLLLLLLLLSVPAAAQPTVRYLAPMEEELGRLRLDPLCEALGPIRARCTLRHVTDDARRELTLTAVYSDESDTIYLYVDRLAVAPPEDESTPAVLRRIAELNWRLLTAKLEWNPSDGEVRMSAVLHTDSNFDRRAFRNLVRMLLTQADRWGPELQRLANPE